MDPYGSTVPQSAIGPYYVRDIDMVRRSFKQAQDAHFNLLTGSVFHCWHRGNEDPDAHFTYPVAYRPEIHPCLTVASELGLHVLVTDNNFTGCGESNAPSSFDSGLAHDCLGQFDGAGTDALTLAERQALWGYNLWDEPNWLSGPGFNPTVSFPSR